MLVLEFFDVKTNSLLWQATASAAINPVAILEEQQQKTGKIIAHMLAKFPPGN